MAQPLSQSFIENCRKIHRFNEYSTLSEFLERIEISIKDAYDMKIKYNKSPSFMSIHGIFFAFEALTYQQTEFNQYLDQSIKNLIRDNLEINVRLDQIDSNSRTLIQILDEKWNNFEKLVNIIKIVFLSSDIFQSKRSGIFQNKRFSKRLKRTNVDELKFILFLQHVTKYDSIRNYLLTNLPILETTTKLVINSDMPIELKVKSTFLTTITQLYISSSTNNKNINSWILNNELYFKYNTSIRSGLRIELIGKSGKTNLALSNSTYIGNLIISNPIIACKFTKFTILYNCSKKQLVCSVEYLREQDFVRKFSRIPYEFFESPCINKKFQTLQEEYLKSGFSRGHNACANNYRSDKELEKETYNVLNISPQNAKFNNGVWNRLENHCLKKAKESNGIYIITGPLYIPQISDENGKRCETLEYSLIGDNVPVPTHYFKIIYSNETDLKESYIIPNEDIKKSFINFKCDLNEIEKYANIQINFKPVNSDINTLDLPFQIFGPLS